jgi:membrane protein DedA with SNARE-associated domain
MIDEIHYLIEWFRLIAVFLGCIAEDKSAAILGGFLAHQELSEAWQVLVVAFGLDLGVSSI